MSNSKQIPFYICPRRDLALNPNKMKGARSRNSLWVVRERTPIYSRQNSGNNAKSLISRMINPRGVTGNTRLVGEERCSETSLNNGTPYLEEKI